MKKITNFLPLFTAWAIRPVSSEFYFQNLIVATSGDSNPLFSNHTGIIDYFTESSH